MASINIICHGKYPSLLLPKAKGGRLSKSNPVILPIYREPIPLPETPYRRSYAVVLHGATRSAAASENLLNVNSQALPKPTESETMVGGVGPRNPFSEPSR